MSSIEPNRDTSASSKVKAVGRYFRTALLALTASAHSIWSTGAALGVIVTLGYVILGLITLLRGWFQLPMLPIFESTFDAIRTYVHLGLEWIFFHWIALALSFVVYCGMLLASLFSAVIPYLPEFSFPNWVKDVTLVSIIILRVFESAYFVIPRKKRDAERARTTPEQFDMIKQAQGKFWGSIHYHIDKTNRQLYDVTDWITYKLQTPCRSLGWDENHKISRTIRRLVRELVGGVLLQGYVRLAGYFVYLPKTWSVDAPTVISIKETFLYFLVCFIVASFTVGLWFWGNSYWLAAAARSAR
jgi:hypothetical protein